MPTYEYECEDCGAHLERFQRMSDDPLKTCPECGGSLRRLLGTGAGFIIKGAGAGSGASGATRCGRETTCCGRDTPCAQPPCDA